MKYWNNGSGIGKGKALDSYERIHKRKDAIIIKTTKTENFGFVRPKFNAINPPIEPEIINNAPSQEEEETAWDSFIISE